MYILYWGGGLLDFFFRQPTFFQVQTRRGRQLGAKTRGSVVGRAMLSEHSSTDSLEMLGACTGGSGYKRAVASARRRTVTFGEVSIRNYAHALDGSKLPSDGAAPLGLGGLVSETDESFAAYEARRERQRSGVSAIPAAKRRALLADVAQPAELAAMERENCALLTPSTQELIYEAEQVQPHALPWAMAGAIRGEGEGGGDGGRGGGGAAAEGVGQYMSPCGTRRLWHR